MVRLAQAARGNVYTFGLESCGVLGNGGDSTLVPRPVQFFEHTNSVAKVDCGPHHTLALTKDGRVYTWGHNVATRFSSNKKPVAVPFHAEIEQIAAGSLFSAVVEKGGHKVYIWGSFSSLGPQLIENPVELTEVTALLKKHHTVVKKIVAAENALAILTQNGKLIVYGNSQQGQLGVNQFRGTPL